MEDKKFQDIQTIICNTCKQHKKCDKELCTMSELVAKELSKFYQQKIAQNSVVIPKEISCYKNIEKGITTFRLDGNNVDFTDEQIMALTQIILFKEKQENEIRKETANKIFQKGKEFYFFSSDKGFNLSSFLDWILFEFELAKANDDGTVVFDKKYFKE